MPTRLKILLLPILLPSILLLPILFVLLACPVSAQQRAAGPETKSPGRATLYSFFVPGGGHLYAGERGRGALLLVGSAAAVVGGAALSNFERDYDYTCASGTCIDPNAYHPDYTPFFVGAGVAGALWLYSLLDAPRAARRANRQSAVAVAPGATTTTGRIVPGLTLRVRL